MNRIIPSVMSAWTRLFGTTTRAKKRRGQTLRLESLEVRLAPATYNWSDAGKSIQITLDDNESLTVSEAAGDVTFTLSAGTFTQTGTDTADGDGTATIVIPSSALTTTFAINNETASGTNNVTFNTGTLSTALFSVNLSAGGAGTVGTITFAGFDVSATAEITLTTPRNIIVGSGVLLSTSGSGTITMTANREELPTSGAFNGILIDKGVIETTGTGEINLSGRGGDAAGGGTSGIRLASAEVKSTAMGAEAGQITLQGTGGSSINDNFGVDVATSAVTAVDGQITITGVGGTGTEAGNRGIAIRQNSGVTSTGMGSNAAIIVLDGTGGGSGGSDGNNEGVVMSQNGSQIASVDSTIIIRGSPGIGSANRAAISILGGQIVTTGGSVTVSGDSINLETTDAIDAGANGVTLRPRSNSTPIDVGGDDVDGTLGLTNAELNEIIAGRITIGDDENPGSVTVTAPIALDNPAGDGPDLKLSSESLVDVLADVNTDNGDLTLEAPTIFVENGRTLTVGTGTVIIDDGSLDLGQLSDTSILTVVGKLEFTGADFHFNSFGSTPGDDYDQIVVTAGVTIDADLSTSFGVRPTAGQTFTIIDNQSADPIAGTFNDKPEGALFEGDEETFFRISYVGGTGNNDVVLTYVEPPASLVVSSTDDEDDGDYSAGQLTLREAILLANLLDDANTISFDATVFASATTIVLDNGIALPALANDVTITGPGASLLTIDADDASNHLTVNTGVTAALSGVTLINGVANGGGCIFVQSDAELTVTDSVLRDSESTSGGAILNSGTLHLERVVIADNASTGRGGGVASPGRLTVRDSTISGNTALRGGGLELSNEATLVNVTISGNSATFEGGGLNVASTATLRHVTVTGNKAGFFDVTPMQRGGGISHSSPKTIFLYNSIVAGNVEGEADTPSDLDGDPVEAVSSGNAIGDADTAGGMTDGDNGNVVGVNGVGLRPIETILDETLADNGGPTPTHALVAGSVAIDAGDTAEALDVDGTTTLTTDQRGDGFARNQGTSVDAGAFEVQDAPEPPPPTPVPPLFLDLNGDGVRQDGERPLANRRVYLDLDGDGTLDDGEPFATTGPDGVFVLEGEGQLRQFLFPGDFDAGIGSPTRLNSTLVVIPVVDDLFQQAGSASEGFIESVYRAVLGREAEQGGVDNFMAMMAQGMTAQQVADAVWNSAEHRLAQIAGYYRDYLGRDASDAEKQGHLTAFLSGASEEQVVIGFLTSAEFTALYPDDSAFVDRLYFVLLGRFRGEGEAPQWEQLVASQGRAFVVNAFLAESECRFRAIDGFYVGLLNREGEEAGRQNWLGHLADASLGYGATATQFLMLQEFMSNAASA